MARVRVSKRLSVTTGTSPRLLSLQSYIANPDLICCGVRQQPTMAGASSFQPVWAISFNRRVKELKSFACSVERPQGLRGPAYCRRAAPALHGRWYMHGGVMSVRELLTRATLFGMSTLIASCSSSATRISSHFQPAQLLRLLVTSRFAWGRVGLTRAGQRGGRRPAQVLQVAAESHLSCCRVPRTQGWFAREK